MVISWLHLQAKEGPVQPADIQLRIDRPEAETTVEVVSDQKDHFRSGHRSKKHCWDNYWSKRPLWRWSLITDHWSLIKGRTLEMFKEIAVRVIWCSAQLVDICQNLLSIRTTTQSGEHFRTNSIFCSRVSRSLLDSATSGGFHISATRMEEVRRIIHFMKSRCRPSHGSYWDQRL